MSLDLTDDKSTLVQVMAWCRQATCHYLSQCWPRSLSPYGVTRPQWVKRLRPRQNGRCCPDNIFRCIFLNGNVWIPIMISLKFVPKYPIINIPALVQIMAWRRSGDKPLSDSMMTNLLMHICVTRLQWVNTNEKKTHITKETKANKMLRSIAEQFEGCLVYQHPIINSNSFTCLLATRA